MAACRCRIQRDRWGEPDYVVQESDTVSCEEMRNFWIQWHSDSGLIIVGRGRVPGIARYNLKFCILFIPYKAMLLVLPGTA